jgi:hypothetical protein
VARGARTEGSLDQVIRRTRQALGEDIVETVPRQGYRLGVEVRELRSDGPPPRPQVRPPPDRLFGREQELRQLTEALALASQGEEAPVLGEIWAERGLCRLALKDHPGAPEDLAAIERLCASASSDAQLQQQQARLRAALELPGPPPV